VPVIVPPDAKRTLAFLADTNARKRAGVIDGNPYLFPNSGIILLTLFSFIE
jgi:hypothetical protein